MERVVALHNPALMSDEELESTFVGREALLDDVMRRLREQAEKPVNQSVLIVGPRGMGKTNFIHMIRRRVLTDDGLRAQYEPVLLPEENYAVTSVRDLFCQVLDALGSEGGSDSARAGAERARVEADEEAGRELALDALRQHSTDTGRKLLVFIENLDLVIGDQIGEEADIARLRSVLMNEGFLALIATSPTHFKEVRGYDQPLYNFFRLVELDDLPLADAEALLRRRAEWEGNRGFLDRFDEYRKRLPAIRHLTGGVPRLVLMLYTVLCQKALVEVKNALEALLDELTPYYKARIERLAPQQRKVLDAFAREGRALTPTEIARASRISSAQASAVLGRLEDEGFVRLAEQKRRKQRFYVVSERMFRIWHQMRSSAAGRRRMQYLIEFIGLWYSAEEAREEADRLLVGFAEDVARGERGRASEKADYLGYLAAGVGDSSASSYIANKAIAACIEAGQCEEAERLIEEELRRAERDGEARGVANAHFCTGLVRHLQGRHGEAAQALRSCVAADPANHHAFWRLGVELTELAAQAPEEEAGRLLREACEKHAQAVALKPDMHEALYGWGVVLAFLATRTSEEARPLLEQACRRFAEAVRAKPDLHEALNAWGGALSHLATLGPDEEARYLLEEACRRFAEAVRAKPDFHEALYRWSVGLLWLSLLPAGEGRRARTAAEAVEKAREAVRQASAPGHPDAPLYRSQLGRARLAQAFLALVEGDLPTAQAAFAEGLESLEQDAKVRREVLVPLFRAFLSRGRVSFFSWAMGLMRERGLEEDVEVLAPFQAAITYWERDRDETVLERLNPEVRGIVEEIIRDAKEREVGRRGK